MLTGILFFLAVLAFLVCFMACATATQKSHIIAARIALAVALVLLSGGVYSFFH